MRDTTAKQKHWVTSGVFCCAAARVCKAGLSFCCGFLPSAGVLLVALAKDVEKTGSNTPAPARSLYTLREETLTGRVETERLENTAVSTGLGSAFIALLTVPEADNVSTHEHTCIYVLCQLRSMWTTTDELDDCFR